MAFYNENDDITNFEISFTKNPRNDFAIFAKGYTFAANSVATELINIQHFVEYKAYPVVFLYRHALELHLKNIIYRVALLLAFRQIEDLDIKLYNSHDLCFLSQKVYNLILKACPNDLELHELAKKITKIAQEFSDIDPNSYAYRYPINRDGKHSTKKNQIVNLQSIVNHMDGLLSALEDVNFGLSIEIHLAQEIYEMLDSI